MPYSLSFRSALALAALLILADQALKRWIVQLFPKEGLGIVVSDCFNLIRIHNHGAAFSFLADQGGWQRWFFIALAVVVCTVLFFIMRRTHTRSLARFGFANILAGALGNVIDRLWHGYVIDYLDFHAPFLNGLFPGGHYPAFNLADSCITVGVICVLIDEWRGAKHTPADAPKAAS